MNMLALNRVVWEGVVGQQDCQPATLSLPYHPGIDGRMHILHCHHEIGANMVEQLECPIRRLGNAVERQQPEATVKWS